MGSPLPPLGLSTELDEDDFVWVENPDQPVPSETRPPPVDGSPPFLIDSLFLDGPKITVPRPPAVGGSTCVADNQFVEQTVQSAVNWIEEHGRLQAAVRDAESEVNYPDEGERKRATESAELALQEFELRWVSQSVDSLF